MNHPLMLAARVPVRAPGSAVHSFLQAIPAALLVLAPHGLSALAGNAEAAALLRCSQDAVPAAWQAALAGPDGPALAAWLRRRPEAAGSASFPTVLRLADGSRRALRVQARQAVLEGQPWLLVTLAEGEAIRGPWPCQTQELTPRDCAAALGGCPEATARRRAEQAQALLLRELDHRVKNLFAVIAGLVTFTARGVQSPQEMRATLLGRIEALAQAHDLVKLAIGGGIPATKGPGHHTTLGVLAEALLAPYRGASECRRLRLEGEEIGVGALAAAPLALLLHELATNAARHGALARPGGLLALRWRRAEENLHLVWDEQLGLAEPPVPAGEPGVGQRLVTQSALQLGGRAGFAWRPQGLLVELSLPLARLDA